MTTATEQAQHPLQQDELRYWMRRGPKTAAFLLVIPGTTLIAVGAGILLGQTVPVSIIGVGAGMLVWGLIVALTK